MNKDIIEILKKSEDVEFDDKINGDYKYHFIRGQYGKVYLLCEEMGGSLEETLKVLEKICISDDVLKEIWPQFIYVVIIKQVTQVDVKVLKDVIAVEENEYFCKKYVLYYEEKEVNALKTWMDRNGEYKLGNMMNLDECTQYMKESDDKEEKCAVKILLRIVIKCPFVKYEFDKDILEDFELELENKLKGIRKPIDKNKMMDYKENFYDKLEPNNIDEIVELFIQSVRKEAERDVI